MTIMNGSSYRMGREYKLDIEGKGVLQVTVENKDKHKLLLKLPDGIKQWFNYNQLTSTKKVYPSDKVEVKKPVAKTEIKVDEITTAIKPVAKVEPKKAVVSIPKKSEATPSEIRDNNFWQMAFGVHMHELKKGLIKKGYSNKIKSWSPNQIRELVLANIKDAKEVDE